MQKSFIRKTIDRMRARRLLNRACQLKSSSSPKHLTECVDLLRQATRLGSSKAALELVDVYMDESNLGTYQPEKAQRLLTRLADKGIVEACYILGRQLHEQMDLKSVDYLTKATSRGYAPAQVYLGKAMLAGNATQTDIQTGVHLLSQAAESGYTEAQYVLAKAFYEGTQIPKNPDRALYWAIRAALTGDISAQKLMATIREDKNSPDRDVRESYFWMRQAAKQGDAYAQAYVGECLQEGRGIYQNKAKAVEYYQKATDQGDGFATTRLGLCYIYGRGVEEDKEKGIAFLKAAADSGYEFAPIHLVLLAQGHIIDLSKSEVERYSEAAKAKGLAFKISEEPIPTGKRKKSWVESEFSSAVFWQTLHEDGEVVYEEEEDEPLPTPFDPLLNLGKRIISPFIRSFCKKQKT